MIDAGDGADHLAGGGILRHQIGQRPAVAVAPEEVGVDRHHVARHVDAVDRFGVLFRGEQAHLEALRPTPRGPVGREVEPEGVGGVEEQLQRRRGEQNVGIAHVEGDVATLGLLLPEMLHERRHLLERLREDELAPAALDACFRRGLGMRVDTRADRGLQPLVAQFSQPMRLGVAASPWARI